MFEIDIKTANLKNRLENSYFNICSTNEKAIYSLLNLIFVKLCKL